MKTQPRERHGTRRGKRALTVDVTPELARDVVQLFGAVLQVLFDHEIIHQRDVANLVAQNPPHHSRRHV
jgi:hypothetical protein